MQRRARVVGALLLILLALLPATASQIAAPSSPTGDPPPGSSGAPGAPSVERFVVDPPHQPVATGDSVTIRAIVDPGDVTSLARLHVRAAGPGGVEELEPAPVPVANSPALLVTFWEPREPGRYIVTGHVHLDGDELPLPVREGRVWSSQALDRQPVDPSTWQIGIAPGTVLWSLVFMGLAYASQRWMLDSGDES